MKLRAYLRQKYPVTLIAGLGGLFTIVSLAPAQDWTLTSAPLVPGGFDPGWKAVAASADFKKLVAAGWFRCKYGCSDIASPIYISADSGVTWTQTSSPTNTWSSVASSADGVKLVAATTYDNSSSFNPGLIYISADGGATWRPTAAPSNYWTRVASSADGTRLVASAGDDPPPLAPAPERYTSQRTPGPPGHRQTHLPVPAMVGAASLRLRMEPKWWQRPRTPSIATAMA